MKNNPTAFVTLDKYLNDLTTERVMIFYARKKFERIDAMLKHQVAFIDSLESSTQGLYWLRTLRSGLQDILDIERPDVAASSSFSKDPFAEFDELEGFVTGD